MAACTMSLADRGPGYPWPQVKAFGERLRPHQKATLGSGTTVLEAAVVPRRVAPCSTC